MLNFLRDGQTVHNLLHFGLFTDASLMSLMASLVTTSRMQQCFNVLIDIYLEFLLLFYCCVLLEIKLTTYYYYVLRDQENAHTQWICACLNAFWNTRPTRSEWCLWTICHFKLERSRIFPTTGKFEEIITHWICCIIVLYIRTHCDTYRYPTECLNLSWPLANKRCHWFWSSTFQWTVACSAPSHNLNQWWFIVYWTLKNKSENSFGMPKLLHLKMLSAKLQPFWSGIKAEYQTGKADW